MKIIKTIGLLMTVIGIDTASAHTISMGSFNAGVPGSVTIVMGTYDHGGPLAQGSITLITGPGVPPAIGQNFTNFLLSKPAGLIDGVNNFYADATPATYGLLPSDSYTKSTNTVGLGNVINWQAATFTGLSAGTYTYQLAGMTSANWANINSFQNNWTGTIVIPRTSIVGAVPDGGSTVVMLGAALMGIARFRRSLHKA